MSPEIRKPPVGARPGTLVIGADASKPVVRVVSYSEETLEEHDSVGVEMIEKLEATGRRLWVDVQGLGDEGLLRRLAEIFEIHPLALEDVVHRPVRPKAQIFQHNLLIVTRTVRLGDSDELDVQQKSLIAGSDYVLTFQEKYGDALDPVRQRLMVPNSRMRRLTSDYLAYAILDTIIDGYYPVMEAVAERLESLEEWVRNEVSEETPSELNNVKADLLVLRRAIAPQREAVQTLIRGDDELVSDTVRVYLRDTFDHIVQIAEAVEQGREFVSGLMNTYLTLISNRMNEVMKTLTIVASVFIPLTFLAGIYGMNFEHMPELAVEWAYPVLLGVMALVTCGMVVYFWRKGWLRRR